MAREEILAQIESIQDRVDKMGFKGQNEYDLHLREELTDWLIKKQKEDYIRGMKDEREFPFKQDRELPTDDVVKKEKEAFIRGMRYERQYPFSIEVIRGVVSKYCVWDGCNNLIPFLESDLGKNIISDLSSKLSPTVKEPEYFVPISKNSNEGMVSKPKEIEVGDFVRGSWRDSVTQKTFYDEGTVVLHHETGLWVQNENGGITPLKDFFHISEIKKKVKPSYSEEDIERSLVDFLDHYEQHRNVYKEKWTFQQIAKMAVKTFGFKKLYH
jgi:hypothetical protein